MLPDQPRPMSTHLSHLAALCGASHLRVFGLVARGEETPDRDVNFMIELPRDHDLFDL